MQTKPCSNCHARKPLEDFGIDSRTRSGRASWCRACDRKRAKTYIKHRIGRAVRSLDGLTVEHDDKAAVLLAACEILLTQCHPNVRAAFDCFLHRYENTGVSA